MTLSSTVSYHQSGAEASTPADTGDRIASVEVSLVFLPLAAPISDAKVQRRP
jgi:hypothetical protein